MSLFTRTLSRIIPYSRPATDLAGPIRDPFALGNVTVSQVKTFQALLNTFSKTYDFRYDEALKEDPAFALKMIRDPFYRALMQERIYPLSGWKRSLVPPDATDKQQVERAKWYEKVVHKQPMLSKKINYLGKAIWYGRYASQMEFTDGTVQHDKWATCKYISKHKPVNGDKIVSSFEDDAWGIRINPMFATEYPREDITYDNRGTAILLLRKPEFRKKFIFHVHELDDADYFESEMAGRVSGIGLRDFVYYGAHLRSKLIEFAVAFMEKVGTLGLLIFRYPEGNAQAKRDAEQAAREASNRNALAIPMPKGGDKNTSAAELLPANMTGVQFLVDIIAGWWERHSERLFIGQSMSAGEGSSSLGGGERAELANTTKFNILRFDAEGLAESLTEDEIKITCELNGDPGWDLKWKFSLPDPEAEKKLESITKAASIPGKKLKYPADQVRELVGMSAPGPDDEIVGGEEEIQEGTAPNNFNPNSNGKPNKNGKPVEKKDKEKVVNRISPPSRNGTAKNGTDTQYSFDEKDHPRGQSKNAGQFVKGSGSTSLVDDEKDLDEIKESDWDGNIEKDDVEIDSDWHDDDLSTFDKWNDEGENKPHKVVIESGQYTPEGHDEVEVFRWVSLDDDGDVVEEGEWISDEKEAIHDGKAHARSEHEEPPDPEDKNIPDNIDGSSWKYREVISEYTDEDGDEQEVRLDEATFEFAGQTHTAYRWTTKEGEDGEWTLKKKQAMKDGEKHAQSLHHEKNTKQENTDLPTESRPDLDDSEIEACEAYSHKFDQYINRPLRGQHPHPDFPAPDEPKVNIITRNLEEAINKVKPWHPPTTVRRGLKKLDSDTVKAFVDTANQCLSEDKTFTMSGFISTTTNSKVGSEFSGEIEFEIEACHGLDMMPYSHYPDENELLLKHNSQFKVDLIERKGSKWVISLRQIVPGFEP